MSSKLSKKILSKLLRCCLRPFMSDTLYLKVQYKIKMRKTLDLDNPITMNEKLQWLKINNRYPEMTDMVDKLKVKAIVADKIGENYVIKTIKTWNSPDELSFEDLPSKFVIKTNHSGGNLGVYVCRDKTNADIKGIKNKMRRSLKDDIYYNYAEWPYKGIERKIFAEEYIGDCIVDYKFYCFNGYVDCVLLCIDRDINAPKFYFFNKDWNLLRYNKRGLAAPKGFSLPKPKNMDKMFEIASQLSLGFPFVRVDLYNIDGEIFFGEMTFYPDSGFDSNRLSHIDEYFGNLINLNIAKIKVQK